MLCSFAPIAHTAPATTLLHVDRPCGHHMAYVHACDEHAQRFPDGHEAGRPTFCNQCGAASRIRVTGREPYPALRA
jgi:hypothetical protein